MMTRTEIEQAVTGNLSLIRGVVCKTLRKYGANLCSSDVEDIESNTVLCLLDGRMDNYRHTTEKKLQQWIGYIAMQRCIDYLRALKKNVPLEHDGDDDSPSHLSREILSLAHDGPTPEAAYLEREFQLERRARLQAAVDSLSSEEQHSYHSMADEDYTVRSYAEREGVKESTVHTRRHRLVKNLRKCI
jgi:RNA polymerase sigma factor (sigma-70 family)